MNIYASKKLQIKLASDFDQLGLPEAADDTLDAAKKMHPRTKKGPISVPKSIYDIDADAAYDSFKSSYDKATGHSWPKDKFLERAQNWDVWGDDQGFISTRKQTNGVAKLTGAAGNPKGIMRALQALVASEQPVWGFVSKDIQNMLIKTGHFITPPDWLIKALMRILPAKAFHGNIDEIRGKNGGITMQGVEKFFVANRQYYAFLSNQVKTNPDWAEKLEEAQNKFGDQILGGHIPMIGKGIGKFGTNILKNMLIKYLDSVS